MGVHDSESKYSQPAPDDAQLGNKCDLLDDKLRNSNEFLHLNPAWNSIKHNSQRRSRFFVGSATVFSLILLIVQLVLMVDVRTHVKEKTQHKPSVRKHAVGYHPSTSPDPEWPCGITAEEARMYGCSFDLGLVAWMPQECYNKELDDSFRSRVPFDIWLPNEDNTGPDLTKPVTTEKQFQELVIQMVDLGWPGHSTIFLFRLHTPLMPSLI